MHISYQKLLKRLNIPSLELRRLHCDLIWCFKIVGYSVIFMYTVMIILSFAANQPLVDIVSSCVKDTVVLIQDLFYY